MPDYPYITGHCGNGACEGSKKLSVGGALLVACSGDYEFRSGSTVIQVRCECVCHNDFRAIRETMRALKGDTATEPEPILGPIPVVEKKLEPIEPDFHPTDSGRRNRGELEHYVFEVVNRLLTEGTEEITPSLIQMEVGIALKGEYLPSEGAIYSVLKRWSEEAIAVVETSPFRITAMDADVRASGIIAFRESQRKHIAKKSRGFF